MTDAAINAKKPLTCNIGVTKPKNENPLWVNALIEILGTTTVKR